MYRVNIERTLHLLLRQASTSGPMTSPSRNPSSFSSTLCIATFCREYWFFRQVHWQSFGQCEKIQHIHTLPFQVFWLLEGFRAEYAAAEPTAEHLEDIATRMEAFFGYYQVSDDEEVQTTLATQTKTYTRSLLILS